MRTIYILSTIIAICLFPLSSSAQSDAPGTSRKNPIIIENVGNYLEFVDIQDTRLEPFASQSSNGSPKKIYYKVVLPAQMALHVHHFLPTEWVDEGYINQTQILIRAMDNVPVCSHEDFMDLPAINDKGKAFVMVESVRAGEYIIECGGAFEDGLIRTTIRAWDYKNNTLRSGYDTAIPVQMGTYSQSFSFTAIRNTDNFWSSWGTPAPDVKLAFELEAPMWVVIDLAGTDMLNNVVDAYRGPIIYLTKFVIDPEDYVYLGRREIAQSAFYKNWEIFASLPDMAYGKINYRSSTPILCQYLDVGKYEIYSEGMYGYSLSSRGYLTGPIQTNVYGFTPEGNSRFNPIEAGNLTDKPFKDTKNGQGYIWQCSMMQPQVTPEIYYSFSIDIMKNIKITGVGSSSPDTEYILTDENLRALDSSNNYEKDTSSDTPASQILYEDLPAGSYYVIAKISVNDSNITTSISNFEHDSGGDSPDEPIILGPFHEDFLVNDMRNTEDYSDNYPAYPTNDVFYEISITRPMDLHFSHSSEQMSHISVSLLDYEKTLISNSVLELRMSNTYSIALEAGTYYYVVEGTTNNGIIHSAFTGSVCDGIYPDPVIFEPTPRKNYILSITPRIESSYSEELSASEASYEIDYFDGLGRPVQKVIRAGSPSKKDMVTFQEYNEMGLESRSWLPTPYTSSGGFVPLDNIRARGYEIYGELNTYSYPEYDNTHLARVVKAYQPGAAWQSNEIGVEFKNYFNSSQQDLICPAYVVADDGRLFCRDYDNGTIYVNKTIDEDGNPTWNFTDKSGRTVMTTQYYDNTFHDTCYVYDDYGNLTYVLPPLACVEPFISLETLSDLCYQYRYDHRNRCIAKKLPGADWEYFIYDRMDRMVASQDGYWRGIDRWKLYEYDNLGRMISIGARSTGNISREQLQTIADSNPSPSALGSEYTIEQYAYDGYAFLADYPQLNFQAVPQVTDSYDPRVKTFLTFESKAVLDSHDIKDFDRQPTAYYYDYRGRTVQSVSLNRYGKISRTSFKYDFTGNILTMHESHEVLSSGNPDVLVVNYTYDHAGRMLSEETTLNGETPALVEYRYDELGRLKSKTMGDGTPITETYAYNIRGWETSRSNPYYQMALRYNNPVSTDNTPQYGGNISEWEWIHTGDDLPEGQDRTMYGFDYDALNRLIDTRRYDNSLTALNSYTEKGLDYDLNGNILSLQRYGLSETAPDHDLNYTYSGNRLTALNINGDDVNYRYDANGNMVYDGRQGIDFEYNFLNLISSVEKSRMETLEFPSDSFKEGNSWRINLSLGNTRTVVASAANGFSGGYERFEVIEGGVDERISVYNAYLNSNGYGKTSTVWMTIEYRSNVDLCDFGTMNMVLPANTGQAKTVTVILKNVGLLGMVFSADSWLEIRTLALGTVAETESQKATYTWLSDGTKLGVDNAGNGFDYLGSLVYKRENDILSLESAPFSGGRIIATTSGFTPNYFLTDHLGSTRVIIDGANGDAVSRNDYYPFGMRIKKPTFAYNDNRYLYNGKEDQSVAGTDFLDYGARNYDALLGKWFNIDPLAEKYYGMSPYVYVGNNPIIYIDPDGRDTYYFNVQTGEKVWLNDTGGTDRQFVYFVTPGEEGGLQEIGFGFVSGAEVYLGKTSDGWAMAKVDLWEDLPDNLSGYEGYTYNLDDLVTRYNLKNGPGRVIQVALNEFEQNGHAEPITKENYWDLYGQTNGNLLLIDNFFNMAMAFTPSFGVNSTSKSYSLSTTKGGVSGKAATSTTPQKSPSSKIKSAMNKRMMKGKNASKKK